MKSLIFDMDGTLVDSMPVWSRELIAILDKYNIPYPSDFVEKVAVLSTTEMSDLYINMGVPLSKTELSFYAYKKLKENYETCIPLKDNVKETLDELYKKGYKLYTLSSTTKSLIEICYKRLGIYEYFTEIWSSESFNADKADPSLYIKVAEKINEPTSNIVMIDDNIYATIAAKKAGMTAIGIYDLYAKEYESDFQTKADFYIHDISQLLSILK